MAFYCKDLLHGNGSTRWFDKSLTAVIYENGMVSEKGGGIPVIMIVFRLLVGAGEIPLNLWENRSLK
jgi:hypothetical protein